MIMEIIRKGWKIRAKFMEINYGQEDIIVHATTRDKAKSLGYKKMMYLDIQVEDDSSRYSKYRNVEYVDVIAKRCKEEDTYLYEGQEKTKREINRLEWCKNRNLYAENLVETYEGKVVVWNGSYGQYWGSNHCGYNSDLIFAGRYTPEEAFKIVSSSEYGRQEEVRILDVEKINSGINSRIEKLKEEIERLESIKV